MKPFLKISCATLFKTKVLQIFFLKANINFRYLSCNINKIHSKYRHTFVKPKSKVVFNILQSLLRSNNGLDKFNTFHKM